MEVQKYVAMDTETYKGKAFLLSTAERVYQLKGFTHFVDIAQNLGTHFVFFNLEYDVSAILKYLPQSVVESVYLDKQVKYREFALRYLAGKYFKISFGGGCLHFYDIYPFFQTSLDKASQKYLNERKRDMPKSWLKRMSPDFYQKHKKQIDAYALQDAKLTQKLADLICGALEEAGIEVDHLYSPGFVAKTYLRQRGVRMEDVPKKHRDFVKAGYYGARIEVVRKGKFENAQMYDIKSAYPFALSQLPNFSSATYRLTKDVRSKWFFIRAKVWSNPADSHLLPYRNSQGLIVFPQFNGQETTMTNFEYQYLVKHKLAKFEILEVLNIWPNEERVFAPLIKDLFARRKESTGKSILFKLILNSLYGIFAEKIVEYKKVGIVRAYYQILREGEQASRDLLVTQAAGYCIHAKTYWERTCSCGYCNLLRQHLGKRTFKDKPLLQNGDDYYNRFEKAGRMSNLTLAAMITALIRVRIFDFQRQAGNKFIACATDSIMTEKVNCYKTGDQLGDLQFQYDTPLLMIGSGVYETKEETKTRGFRWIGKLSDILKKSVNRKRTVVHISQKARVSAGIMVRRPLVRYAEFNEIQDVQKDLDLNFDKKRIWERKFANCRDALRSQIVSNPIILLDKKRKK